ncbi:hypothetical protein ACUN4K_02050 [Hafnia alvei]|uniref:hypothetical protein n=1 Tax=Hafnia alvei TaxID=569 RepID=UPI0040455982
MTKLTTERLEKLQDDLLQFQDAYSDPADKENYDIFVNALHVIDEFKAAKEKLLAYEQAAEKPYGYLEPCDFPRTTATVYPEKDKYAFMPLYAAPVLPKQPELVENLKKVMNSWLAMEPKLAYQPEFTDVMMLLDAEPAPAQPVIPEQPEPTISFYRDGIIAAAKWVENQRDAYDNEHGQSDPDTGAFEFGNDAQLEYSTTLSEIAEGIRSLHPASAQPVSEPYKLPDGYCIMPKRLTAENGAKYALSGEFSTSRVVVCPECDGDGCSDCDGRGDYEEDQLIEWTTIKNIYSAAVSACELHFQLPAQESE